MKKAIIDNMCCEGCANEVKRIFESIYGINYVSVSLEESTVIYEGYVSQKVIEEALQGTSYNLVQIEKL